MIRGTFASFALGAAVFSQSGLVQAQPDSGAIAVAEASTPDAAAQPAPAPSGQPATPSPAPESQPAPNAQQEKTQPAVTQLPPVKVAPKTPAAQPRARTAQRPRQERAPVAQTRAPAQRPAAPAEPSPELAADAAALAEFSQGIPMSPVQGSEIPLEKVPSAVSQVSSEQIERTGSPAIEQAIQQYVPGAIISDVNGNAFSTDVQFRGYTASPVEGTPQGLAVYQNGVRINEVFGDTVNWDLIPASAIKNMALVTGNPLYGLNALGGALNITMKDGFDFQGVSSDTSFGSYGRFQEFLQLGKQVGNFAAYAALEGIWDNGWRYYSPSEVRRAYADLGVKDKNTEFHINFTGAENSIGVVGPTPVELLGADYSAVFTSPQTTTNELAQLSMNGSTKLTDNWTLSGVTYWRSFHQKHVDGNVSNVAPCTGANSDGTANSNDTSLLCLTTASGAEQYVLDQRGRTITTSNYYGAGDTIGETDRSTNDSNSFGATLQATDKDNFYGHNNIFTTGASIDHGQVKSTTTAELGTLDTSNWVVTGNGLYLSSPLDIAPLDLTTTTSYYGLYFTDTFDVTDALSVTAGGRYNYEDLSLSDPTGNLTGDHVYTRFNPMAGATYKITPNVSMFGSYAEANRAPTPAELGCANPYQPCVLAAFLVSDPDLQQVVSKTWQGGFRGSFSPFSTGVLSWSADVFHAENYNDIMIAISPAIPTRGYFQNAGNTLREGAEASMTYKWDRLSLYANYAYVDATFRSFVTLSSPSNPYADADGNIFVHPGDHLPLVPPQRLKIGFDYYLTDEWKVGADMLLASSQYYFGDESNQNPQLPGYGVVNFRTSYNLCKNIQLYALVNNVFDHKFSTYGTFYETDIENVSGASSSSLSNPAMTTPAQPLSAYGGIKVTF